MRLYFFVLLLILAVVYFAMPWDALDNAKQRMEQQNQQLQQILDKG